MILEAFEINMKISFGISCAVLNCLVSQMQIKWRLMPRRHGVWKFNLLLLATHSGKCAAEPKNIVWWGGICHIKEVVLVGCGVTHEIPIILIAVIICGLEFTFRSVRAMVLSRMNSASINEVLLGVLINKAGVMSGFVLLPFLKLFLL